MVARGMAFEPGLACTQQKGNPGQSQRVPADPMQDRFMQHVGAQKCAVKVDAKRYGLGFRHDRTCDRVTRTQDSWALS